MLTTPLLLFPQKKKEHLFLYFHNEKKKKPRDRVTANHHLLFLISCILCARARGKKNRKERESVHDDDTSALNLCTANCMYTLGAQVV